MPVESFRVRLFEKLTAHHERLNLKLSHVKLKANNSAFNKIKKGVLNMKKNFPLPTLIQTMVFVCRTLGLFGLLTIALPSAVYAHRGASNEVDACNILVGHERVHFTAYTPKFSNKEYCQSIPHLGATNLVFDYDGKGLRNLTVEFEVTKEPEGTRIFYQEPTKIKSGTVNGVVDFSKFGAGNYLAHVAIVHKDKRIDSHIPFSVGLEEESSDNLAMKALFIVVLIAAVFYVKIGRKPRSLLKQRNTASRSVSTI
jgi:hypothetical protein